ncbi:hypothetical protein ACWT_4816 [Actinoplanes sp. SE50]|uniref:hypothetical protein n=1 Tax=unclassified Actinoplanes TaxID=2626549 RepID=UPI00023EC303|nr:MULTISPECIES: hypothetical protein [unclassified Actinoplanes]AEV85835.1 hypothetical protein ACPL_4946 [Actinoplanes sp. SE50/110]ATO84231.1 hypothetical protein ACWT_4816 [Actinoplanes sp. SE50]SLM01641.1 hypothetical protein ACSP50_4877 [Actinoplanes sp. SE50/110]
MRLTYALVPILIMSLAACGDKKVAAPAATPVTTTTTTTATAESGVAPASAKPVAAPKSPAVVKAKPAGSSNPAFGIQYALLKSSKPATRQITYDLIEWYEGKEATKACAEDGVKDTDDDQCTGWYIRNNNTKLRTLTVDPDATIKLTVEGTLKSVDLKTFLAGTHPDTVIKFTIDANRIVSLAEIFLP